MVEFRKSDANMMRMAWELSASLLSFVVAIGIGYWLGGLLDAPSGGSAPATTGAPVYHIKVTEPPAPQSSP